MSENDTSIGKPRLPRQLSHVSAQGQPRLVSVAGKAVSRRTARGEAWVIVGTVIGALLRQSGGVEIGPVRLLEKTGGKSGAWRKERESHGQG